MSYTFTQLVGTTATTSPSTYGNAFTTLANNNSAINVTIGKSLVNSQHRYLMEKYFDNERSFALDIVGSQKLTLTATPAIGDTSATLTATWTKMTCQQFVNFSSGDQRMAQFTNGSATITWNAGLAAVATTAISTVGVRDYPIPANISKIKDATITVGQLVFTPKPVQSRTEWDYVNTLPYVSDIPQFFFIWNNTLGIWPIPSTSNNVLTFNYKTKVPDLSFSDYSTGNITTATAGSFVVTGTSTSWNTTGAFPLNTDISFLNLCLRIDPPYGDGLWYPIQKFNSDTSLNLLLPLVNTPAISASSTYTIGQIPLLQEDFHDTLVYGALQIYYSTIVKDPDRYQMFKGLYDERLSLMADYLGTKQVNLDLESEIYLVNPNIFPFQTS